MGLARGLSLTALLTTLLKVRRGGLISGHDYQFQSQAMGRRATLRVPCEWCHSKPTGRLGRGASGLGAPEELAPRRSEHNGRMWHCAGRRPVPQDVAHNEPLGIA